MNTSGKFQPLASRLSRRPATTKSAPRRTTRELTFVAARPVTRPDAAYQPGIVIAAELAFAALLLYLCNQPLEMGSEVASSGHEKPLDVTSADTGPVDIANEFEPALEVPDRVAVASSSDIEPRRPAIR